MEPDPSFEKIIVSTQHVCGILLLIFNVTIVLLIIVDNDKRNIHYRKYLCALQIISLAFDTFCDFYDPIVLIHKGLIYSDSFLASMISVRVFAAIEIWLLVEVVFSYFACVYYRRSVVVRDETYFNYRGRRRALLLCCMQVHAIGNASGAVYFMNKSGLSGENLLPSAFDWVKNRTSFVFMPPQDRNMRYSAYVSWPTSVISIILIAAMLVQLVNEVKKVGGEASAATQRFQRHALRSLILQGLVPSLVCVVPSGANTFLEFAPTVVEFGQSFDLFATHFSPIIWLIITKHTFVSSLTILYCSSSYRKQIASLLVCSNRAKSLGESALKDEPL